MLHNLLSLAPPYEPYIDDTVVGGSELMDYDGIKLFCDFILRSLSSCDPLATCFCFTTW
jgi:hypothetical protein